MTTLPDLEPTALEAAHDEPRIVQSDCPHCFESSGYVWEHGNDWNSGPWSNQTNIPCRYCNGTGKVDSEPATLDDLEQQHDEEPF